MSTLSTVLTVILAIVGVLLCIIVLLQSDRAAGLGAISGGSSGSSDSYWSKNRGSSVEGSLARLTKILGAIFMILAFAISLIG